MSELHRCPQCQAELASDAPEGLCPKCLLEQGIKVVSLVEVGPSDSVQAPGGGFEPPTPQELAPLFPQLEVIELLGQGGMGAVYKARQPRLDRLVALKIIRPGAAKDAAFAERFSREAKALARLSHPHIVTVHDFGQAGDLYYFVMEYVDGASLRQMEQLGRLSPQQAMAIVPQVCDALQYAHDQGVVHRDIKPANILVDKKGRVKIADFGIAKLVGAAAADYTLTASEMVLGTPRYMAPEQIERPREVDQRADIYSLGVVFYEMLTGELPLGRFAPPSQKVQMDVRLDEVVLKTLAKEPERRYQRASEVRTDVETISSTPPPIASSAPPAPVNHLNNLLGFLMTPQPEWGRAVGVPMLILTGILICAWLAVTIFVPEDHKLAHFVVGNALAMWPMVFIFPLVFLTLLWKVRSGKRSQSPPQRRQVSMGAGAPPQVVPLAPSAPPAAPCGRVEPSSEAIERLVLPLLPHRKATAVDVYREKARVSPEQAKEAVEAIARKHAIPEAPARINRRGLVVLLTLILVGAALIGFATWRLDLSPILSGAILWALWVPFLIVPSIRTAWRYRGTTHGRRAALMAGVWLFFLFGLPVLDLLAEPESTLNWLYRVTGAKAGRHDVAFIHGVFMAMVLGTLVWLVWFLRKLRRERLRRLKAESEG